MLEKSGTLFAIKRYAIHDGPNIRTTVFFKGCPLRCWWCHNPEGLDRGIALVWSAEKCVGCGDCAAGCPNSCRAATAEGIVWEASRCSGCNTCRDTCPALALEATGWQAVVEEVMAAISQDIPFFDQSGGGVTFSGGEPLQQPAFLLALLKACGGLALHRAVDTCGFAPTEVLLAIAREVDLFLYDLKHMDSERHQVYTGVANTLILHNLRALIDEGHRVQIRLPLIPGINDDEANIRATAVFAASLPGVETIDVLPYHRAAVAKYRKLRKMNPGEDFVPGEVRLAPAVALLEKAGLRVRVGG